MGEMGASIFDSFSAGDILSNIGNTGIQSSDVAAIFIATKEAEENRKAAAEEQSLRERERRLIIASGVTLFSLLFVLIIYLITQKLKNRG